MSDADTTLATLKEMITAFAAERDWHQFHTPKNLSMALAAEAAELMEHFLWVESADSVRRLEENPERKKEIERELADVMIFGMQFANVAGIDLATALREKLARNAEKYPVEKARGRSDKYTEL